MSRKKLTKTIWFGSEVDITGQPILPPIADNSNDLNGLHEGELYLHNADEMPSIWVRTKSGLIKSVTGSGNTPSFWELKTTDNGFNYLYTKLPIVTQYGVTMYSGVDGLNIPSIYNGLPIDHNTIYWENGVLKAKGGGGGIESITKQMVIEALGFTPYSAENPNGYITAASIPSAMKNPYALTFGSKTYDGSSAKEITASDLGAALSSDLSKYLPISSYTASDVLAKLVTVDGSGSGLDADTVDGKQATSFVWEDMYPNSSDNNYALNTGIYRTTSNTEGLPYKNNGNSVIHCNWDNNAANQLFLRYDGDYIAYRRKDGNAWKPWKQLAFTDSNVASATYATSAGNADTLDGVHASKLYQVNSAVDLGGTTANYDTLIVRYSNTSATSNHPYSIVGGNQCVALNLYAGTDYAAQLAVGFGTNYLAYRRKVDSTSWQSWVKINAGLADEATKLQTARTIFGQPFNGTGDVSGDLNGVGRIIRTEPTAVDMDWAGNFIFKNLNSVSANYWHIDTSDGTPIFVVHNNGKVGIGTTNSSNALYIKTSTNTPLFIEQSYSSSWTSALNAFNSSLVAGQHYNINIGHSASKWNHAWFGYYHAGNGSANNMLCLGLNQADDILNILASGNVGIGTTSPTAKLHVVGNILATGGVTMYSARILKNIVDERGLSLSELSVIKPTRYTWKDKRDDRLHIGGIADDIQQVLPEVVYKTKEGVLTMDYGNAGFAIAASLIKPVVDHEQRIKALEKENEMLKQELNRLRA